VTITRNCAGITSSRSDFSSPCEQAVVQAPAPERLIKSGLPTEAMVAYVLAAKYAWHLPLYRQAQILLSQGIAIERATGE
jgi:transposase